MMIDVSRLAAALLEELLGLVDEMALGITLLSITIMEYQPGLLIIIVPSKPVSDS